MTICAACDCGGMEINMTFLNKKRAILATVLIIGIISLSGCGFTFGQDTKTSHSDTPVMNKISEPKELTKTDLSVGKLFIGQTSESVRKEFGEPTIMSILHGNGAPQWEYSSQGLTVGGDPVFLIIVTNKSTGTTPRGIQIGSSEEDVQQAYPNAKRVQYNTQLFVESEDKQYTMAFFFSEGTVTDIILTNEMP
ncbi:hypothetical protein [Desulfosporosinus hippei]|nr:hypothetical protein [Desulfosporosinus hippei]